MHNRESVPLRCLITEQKEVLVLTLVGELSHSNIAELEACVIEVNQRAAKWVIVNLSEVPPIFHRTVVPVFAKLQKQIREKPAQLRIVGLHRELRKTLHALGLLRKEELSNSLAEALQSLLQSSS